LAAEAAREAPLMANQAEDIVAALKAVESNYGIGIKSNAGLPGLPKFYNEGAEVYPFKWGQPQGNAPVCGAACVQRVAHVLTVDKDIFEVIDAIPRTDMQDILKNGVDMQQMREGLEELGLQSRMGQGLADLYKEVAINRQPVIAGVRQFNAYQDEAGQLVQPGMPHAIVVESAEVRHNMPGLNIYDPVGKFYWQPLKTFERFFKGDFVTASQ